MNVLVQVADAVADVLNAGGFTPTFTARRCYLPSYEAEDLDALRVAVVPRSVAISPATKTARFYDCSIDVAVHTRVAAEDDDAVDALLALVQDVLDVLHAMPLADGVAAWMESTNNPVFDAEELREKRVFASLATVKYRAMR